MPSIELDDAVTYYEDRGDGPPIVFVHGAILDRTQWNPQLDALADDYRVLAYDVRGHGRTGPTDRESYTIELLADDLAAFVDALDLERPVVVGHSTGGCIAQVYAARHPDEISGLVLAGTFGPEYLTLADRIQRDVVLRATIPPTRLVGYERVEKALIVWPNELLGKRGSSGDYGNVQRLRERGEPMTTDEFAKTIRAIHAFHDTTIDYDAITVPTLVLYGENEPGLVHAHAARFADRIADVDVRAVPDAGHASNMDNPEFYEDVLREFLPRCFETDDVTPPDPSA